MKDRKQYLIIGAMLAVLLTYFTGCGTFNGSQPPNRFEQKMFNTETNLVPSIVEQAQIIQQEQAKTNVTSFINRAGAPVLQTNIVVETIPVEIITYKTNWVEAYSHTVKEETAADVQTVGAIANIVSPGSGGLIAGLLTGVLGAWARMRSHKKTGNVLAGNIAAIREFIKTSVPDGGKYDQALVKWMADNQTETGTIDSVLTILKRHVTNKDAVAGANEIQNLLNQLKKST